MTSRCKRIFVAALMLLLLNACVTIKPPIQVSRGPGWYTVKISDTLYSIAWRYGLDYKQLAIWNGVDVNEPIHPGQRLRLIKPKNAVAGSSTTSTQTVTVKPTTSQNATPENTQTTTRSTTTKAVDQYSGRDPKKWSWPTSGKLLNTFLASKLDRRGIDIAGTRGQSIRTAAAGKVVYSGNGLAGYGNLIIIKHSDTFLSAYAYCQERLVQEGMLVESGKIVAKMGTRDNTAKLHFEIRRNGKPVDPLKYLPER